jgi:hypothetical protein
MVLSSEIELWPAQIAKNIVEKGLSSDFLSLLVYKRALKITKLLNKSDFSTFGDIC